MPRITLPLNHHCLTMHNERSRYRILLCANHWLRREGSSVVWSAFDTQRLMHRDSLSRFKQSKLWDQFAQECQKQLEFIQEDGDEQQ